MHEFRVQHSKLQQQVVHLACSFHTLSLCLQAAHAATASARPCLALPGLPEAAAAATAAIHISAQAASTAAAAAAANYSQSYTVA
jgi:hypothetical protein